MHTEVEFSIEPKGASGKGAARKLRAQGKVPGVVYGPGMEPVMVGFREKDLAKALSTPAAKNVFLRLRCDDPALAGSRVIVRELQVHPLRRVFVHADFYKPDLTKPIHATVPVRLKGTALGVKLGGILQMVQPDVLVVCLPDQLPDALSVDVSELRPGHSIHVGDIVAPEGVRILTDPKATLCAVIAASGFQEETKGEEGGS